MKNYSERFLSREPSLPTSSVGHRGGDTLQFFFTLTPPSPLKGEDQGEGTKGKGAGLYTEKMAHKRGD